MEDVDLTSFLSLNPTFSKYMIIFLNIDWNALKEPSTPSLKFNSLLNLIKSCLPFTLLLSSHPLHLLTSAHFPLCLFLCPSGSAPEQDGRHEPVSRRSPACEHWDSSGGSTTSDTHTSESQWQQMMMGLPWPPTAVFLQSLRGYQNNLFTEIQLL